MNPSSLASTDLLAESPVGTTAGLQSGKWFEPFWPILILAAVTLAAHGPSILDGLFLDDHLHMTRYASPEWSPRHLLDATTIEPETFMDTWWQDRPVRWVYARPFSVLLSKIVYQLSGGSVKALHGLSVGLHGLGAVLVYCLCRLLTRRIGWSLIGGLLFVVHSHSVYAVGWLAAQNSVVQTVLTLGAVLAYIRASGLCVYAGTTSTVSGDGAGTRLSKHAPGAPAAISMPWMALTILLWLLGLLSRENALIFPAFAALLDLAFGGWQQIRRRMGGYLIMGVLAAAFAYWRLKVFYAPMPDFYVRHYDGPEYIAWWLAKLLHWITGVIWLSPLMIGPTVRFNPFREVPGDCLLMMAIIGIMGTGYFLASRRARGWWLWPAWILLSILPVVPVFAGPQSAYMPAVGFAVAMVLAPGLRHEIRPSWIGKWCPGVAIWFLVATSTYMPIYQTFWHAVESTERLTIAQMAADPPPAQATDVFLINVPFVNIYTQLHLREELTRHSLEQHPFRCHVLTYAQNVLRMEDACRLEQTDAYAFRLSTVGRGYFSGAMGRFLIEAMHKAGKMRPGEAYQREFFVATVTRADSEGVQELEFRFREPLDSPRFCFYIGTSGQSAVRLHFRGANHGEHQLGSADASRVALSSAPDSAPAGENSASPQRDAADLARIALKLDRGDSRAGEFLFNALNQAGLRAEAMTMIRQVAIPVAEALAAPEGDLLALPEWTPEQQTRLRRWWETAVDDGNLGVSWTRRREWESWQRKRDRLFAIQQIAGRIIQTDLYLTGPPFPGPR